MFRLHHYLRIVLSTCFFRQWLLIWSRIAIILRKSKDKRNHHPHYPCTIKTIDLATQYGFTVVCGCKIFDRFYEFLLGNVLYASDCSFRVCNWCITWSDMSICADELAWLRGGDETNQMCREMCMLRTSMSGTHERSVMTLQCEDRLLAGKMYCSKFIRQRNDLVANIQCVLGDSYLHLFLYIKPNT